MTKHSRRALRTLTPAELATATGGYDLLLQQSMEKSTQLEDMMANVLKPYSETSSTLTIALKS